MLQVIQICFEIMKYPDLRTTSQELYLKQDFFVNYVTLIDINEKKTVHNSCLRPNIYH